MPKLGKECEEDHKGPERHDPSKGRKKIDVETPKTQTNGKIFIVKKKIMQ